MDSALRVVGLALLVGGVLLSVGLRFVEEPLALGLLPMALLAVGAFTYYRGRRSFLRRADSTDLLSPGPRVLYLRPRTSDRCRPGREEGLLADVFRPVGRLASIGCASGPSPAGTAAIVGRDESGRRWLLDEQLRTARLVIVHIGVGDGLRNELRRAREVVDPARLLLFSYRLDKVRFRNAVADVEFAIGVLLPAPEGPGRFHRRIGFYRFSSEWAPQFLPVQPWFRRGSSTIALRPVFEQVGVASAHRRLR
jgi:hypothetical protein